MSFDVLESDVAIVGYGPVGQALAAMLGAAGYRVVVLERWPNLYPLPRACVADHEVMRILQQIGIAEDFSKLAVPTKGEYVWLNAAGETLYHFRYDPLGVSGWASRNMIYQPDLEGLLDKKVRTLPNVQLFLGWEATGYAEVEGKGELVARAGKVEGGSWLPTGKTKRFRSRFVIGADGANSFVRAAGGCAWRDLGFKADWLVIDFRPNDPSKPLDMPEAGQICDPARPITLMRHMGRRHVRWEVMLLPGETASEMQKPSTVWPLIEKWATPEDGVLDRAAVYTFRSGVAATWWNGPVLLAGDAAHVMPPFLGQGLCSGMRDARSLFWRLDLVLKGDVGEDVFRDYEAERVRHVTAVIERAVALGKVVCVTDPAEAEKRDRGIREGSAPPPPPFPYLTTGVLQEAARDGASEAAVGRLSLQTIVGQGDALGLMDDLVPAAWQVLVDGEPPPLGREQQAFLDALDARVIGFGASGEPVQDVSGKYAAWMRELGAKIVIVRPDFYVFAASSRLDTLPLLVEDLQRQLGWRGVDLSAERLSEAVS
jgi:2-polyprenyl-6-methoxyphenol hydroxylase-like FAD-dependent oxidoreductase